MADDSCFQGESQIREFLDGNGSLPLTCSCLKLLKPSSDDVNQQFPLEIPSILFEETSLPAELYQPLHSSLGQDLYSISVLPEEGEKADCASSLAFLSILEVPDQSKSLTSLDSHINCQSCIDFQMKSEELCSSCAIDIPSETGNAISPESYEDGGESFKTKNFLTKVLRRQASLKLGGGLMQILMNLTTSKDKLITEKVQDIPSVKWRRCKRAASFDSRKVAILFSILFTSTISSCFAERVPIPGKAAAILRNRGYNIAFTEDIKGFTGQKEFSGNVNEDV
ncbi:putative plant/T5J17-70 protein [Senna tora]|uniref:Putative plant/T5J17-70 protein n=1 Tax=Senna tora TaxID=362788 RepID=A0A835C7G0_9FABA|nr:putative plant/T5J17-70 protein [Senna tora]